MEDSRQPRSPAADNINTIARLEQQFLERRTPMQRFADAIDSFAGSISFLVLHLAILTGWFMFNSGAIRGVKPFDPFPYMLLSMSVSIEAVLLSTFVLMKQNRESKRAEQREQLTLQIDLLSEQEVTKVLQVLRRVCDHLGIPAEQDDPEINLLAENTVVENLVDELKDKLPEK